MLERYEGLNEYYDDLSAKRVLGEGEEDGKEQPEKREKNAEGKNVEEAEPAKAAEVHAEEAAPGDEVQEAPAEDEINVDEITTPTVVAKEAEPAVEEEEQQDLPTSQPKLSQDLQNKEESDRRSSIT